MSSEPAPIPPVSTEPLSSEHVRKIARLAMLDPSDEELSLARVNLSAVLGYVQRLDAAAAGESAAAAVAVPHDQHINALRDDVTGPTLDRQTLLSMAPSVSGPYVWIPAVPGQDGAGGGGVREGGSA